MTRTRQPDVSDDADVMVLPPISFTPSTDLASAVLEAAQAATETSTCTGVVYLLHFDRPTGMPGTTPAGPATCPTGSPNT